MPSTSMITLFEHQTLRQSDLPNPADFAWLLEQTQAGKLPCFTIGYAGQLVINVRHYLAVIRLPTGTVLEILPKISKNTVDNRVETRTWVAQMLADVYGIKSQHLWALAISASVQTGALQNESSETWLQPLIQTWYGLLCQLPTLLPRHYQQATQNNPQAQGKLLIKEQMSHNAHRPHYRYTRHNQFDLHPLWGQFFTTALQKLQNLGVPTPPNVSMAVRQISISAESLPIQQWQTSYQQLTQMLASSHAQRDKHSKQQLKMAVELAWLILQLQDNPTVMPVYGNEVVPAVMINMQQAFERWVSVKLNEKYKGRIQTQARFVWLQDNTSASNRYLQPDVLVYDEQDNRHKTIDKKNINKVVDIKYKQLDTVAQINTADLYQLCTYQQFFQAQQAWLIYPMSQSFTKSVDLTLQQSTESDENSQKIKVIPFDVLTGKILL